MIRGGWWFGHAFDETSLLYLKSSNGGLRGALDDADG